jgi:hypothetical protein
MKEQSFMTFSQQKAMYMKSLKPVELLYNQPFTKPKTVNVTLGKHVYTNAVMGRGGSI